MNAPRRHSHPVDTTTAVEDAFEYFTIGLPRWRVFEVCRRNPLVRVSDRIEALTTVVAVLLLLLAVPAAAAIGTVVHDSQRAVYAQQHHTRHLIAAISDETAAEEIPPGADSTIWVDDNGAPTDAPTPTSRAGVDAVIAALFTYAAVTAALGIAVAATRAVCARLRAAMWQRTIDALVGPDRRKRSQA